MRDPKPTRHLSAYVVTRFGSKTARFKTAVGLGFIITTLGVAVGPLSRSSVAEDGIWGAMSSFFSSTAPFSSNAPPVDHAAMVARPAPHSYRPRPFARLRPHRKIVTAARDLKPPASGTRTMCVRLCDGYAFPVGTYHGAGDNAAHQAVCEATCPDAKTALYVLPNGADQIGNGVELASGRNYSQLPDAFHYTTVLDDACTCHRHGVDGKALSLLHDFTLRRGDAVMTANGVRIFHGSQHFPYRRNDFVALTRSKDVRRSDKDAMRAIERASLTTHTSSKPARAASQAPLRMTPAVPDLATRAALVSGDDRG